MKTGRLIIGSRGSQLALWQANFIRDILVSKYNCESEIKIIKTTGDRIDDLSFDKLEGKGFFTKELEEALLNRDIDLAVHSLKDLMTSQPDGLKLGAVGFSADRREILLINRDCFKGDDLIPVKPNSIIGTSSARRKCQIAIHAPSLKIKDLRGNVPTRVKKLRDGLYDAIIIAAAGIDRLDLDLSDLKVIRLNPDKFLPAPAQGILGIQIRDNDNETESVISRLNSREVALEVGLERGLLARFDSGCSLPLGVYSTISKEKLKLTAVLGESKDGRWVGLKRAEEAGNRADDIIDSVYNRLVLK
ncbi:MAG: hydroxymethylbilane synthase [Candidatus Zixiibacteriota bacterium]|nr:MAG: hydroxymethylbilane synthase [candidate division Zixibacteria bacterium]HHI03284.1 hydroxymethylbilane synthase [candidate division Zixibacteria bacterium]